MDPGSEWPEELANAIAGCQGLLFFVSPASVTTQNCRNEIQYARDHGKSIVAVYLEETPLPPSLQLTLATTHGLKRYALDRDAYRSQLIQALNPSALAAIVPRTLPSLSPRRRERLLWSMALILIGGIALLRFGTETKPAEEKAVRFSVHVPTSLDITPATYFEMFYPPPLSISLDASQLVFSARDESGRPALFLRSLHLLGVRPLMGTEDGVAPFFSPDGTWVGFVSGRLLRKVPLDGGTPETITTLPPGTGFGGASWSVDDQIVYAPSANGGLYLVPGSGGTPVQISTPNTGVGELGHVMPQWLPAGEALILSVRMGMAPEAPIVQVLERATGERHTLVEGAIGGRYVAGKLVYGGTGESAESLWSAPYSQSDFTLAAPAQRVLESVSADLYALPYYEVSDSGSLAYIPVRRQRPRDELLWLDPDGTQHLVAQIDDNFVIPAISPDGRTIATTVLDDQTRAQALWLIDVSRGVPVKLATGGENTHGPIWTPDGDALVFTSDHEGPSNLYIKSLEGSDPLLRLTNSAQHHDAGSFSPDGDLLTYAEMHPETNWDLWILDVESRSPRPFIATPAEEIQPIVAPTGELIAYTSNETGRREVYVERFPLGGAKQRASLTGGEDPTWSRDGSTLYYRWQGSIYELDVSQSTVAGEPTHVLEGHFEGRAGYGKANWDVSPDGRFLVTSRQPVSLESQINVILGWKSLLD
jgi:Tol biopolymer transport system component